MLEQIRHFLGSIVRRQAALSPGGSIPELSLINSVCKRQCVSYYDFARAVAKEMKETSDNVLLDPSTDIATRILMAANPKGKIVLYCAVDCPKDEAGRPLGNRFLSLGSLDDDFVREIFSGQHFDGHHETIMAVIRNPKKYDLSVFTLDQVESGEAAKIVSKGSSAMSLKAAMASHPFQV